MSLKQRIFSPIYPVLACALLLPAMTYAAELAKPAVAEQVPVSAPISFEAAALKTLAAHPQFRQFSLGSSI